MLFLSQSRANLGPVQKNKVREGCGPRFEAPRLPNLERNVKKIKKVNDNKKSENKQHHNLKTIPMLLASRMILVLLSKKKF